MSDRTRLRIAVGGLGLGAVLTLSAMVGAHPAAAGDVAHGVLTRSTRETTGRKHAGSSARSSGRFR